MHEAIGWLATAIFGASYFFRSPASCAWCRLSPRCAGSVHGVMLHAMPVIAANVIVVTLAVYSAWRNALEANEKKS